MRLSTFGAAVPGPHLRLNEEQAVVGGVHGVYEDQTACATTTPAFPNAYTPLRTDNNTNIFHIPYSLKLCTNK